MKSTFKVLVTLLLACAFCLGSFALAAEGLTPAEGYGMYLKDGAFAQTTAQGEKIAGTTITQDEITNLYFDTNVTEIPAFLFTDVFTLQAVTIPDTVKEIGTFAFAHSGLTEVTIQNAVIGEGMFVSCASLESITIPDTVTQVGANAFNRAGLTEVTLKNAVIGDNMFSNCQSLESITIPANVTEVGGSAFVGSGLTEVNIQNAVIGKGMFYGCASLTSVTLPDTVPTSVGANAFADISSSAKGKVTSADVYVKYADDGNFNSDTGKWAGLFLEEPLIPADGYGMYVGADANNQPIFVQTTAQGEKIAGTTIEKEKITNLYFDTDVTAIPAELFYNISNLQSVIIPDTITQA